MWKQILDFGKWLFSVSQESRQTKSDLKELSEKLKQTQEELKATRQELGELTDVVKFVALELRQTQKNEEQARENMILRLENALLHFDKRLPPASGQNDLPSIRED